MDQNCNIILNNSVNKDYDNCTAECQEETKVDDSHENESECKRLLTYQDGENNSPAEEKQNNKNNNNNNATPSTVVTQQPTTTTAAITKPKPKTGGPSAPTTKPKTSTSRARQRPCYSCCYRAKHPISCCTCYWCLESCLFHCIYEDDIGWEEEPGKSRLFADEGSSRANCRKGCFFAACLPLWPCFGVYALSSFVIDKYTGKR